RCSECETNDSAPHSRGHRWGERHQRFRITGAEEGRLHRRRYCKRATPMGVEANTPMVAAFGGADASAAGAALHERLATLVASRWLILYITAAAVLAGLLYARLATPIYRSDVLIQVEEKKRGIAGLDDLS